MSQRLYYYMHQKTFTFFSILTVFLLWTSSAQTQQQQCTDSDNSSPIRLGEDRRIRGSTTGISRVTGRQATKGDRCDPEGRLIEYFCDEIYVSGGAYRCPSGESCVDGACMVATGNGGRNATCDSGNQCQSGYCNLNTRRCEFQPIGGACNDNSQCGETGITCNNYRCMLNLGDRCENHNQCISGYCGGEQYCYGGEGAPRVCHNICSRKPVGQRCANDEDCISGLCGAVPRDPSYGGTSTGGSGPDCFAVVDIPPPLPGEAPPQQPQGPDCIKICRAQSESVPHGERCASHALLNSYTQSYECNSPQEICRPWVSQTTRQFYNISRKFCAAKVRSSDGCWYNAHCQSGVCTDGRCQ